MMKLYKYRSIQSHLFGKYIDSLENGYLWFADVSSLNDRSDSVIYYDNEKEIAILKKYYNENELDILINIIEVLIPIPYLNKAIKKMPKEILLDMVKLSKDNNSSSIAEFLMSKGENQERIDNIVYFQNNITRFLNSKDNEARAALEPILDFNNTVRQRLKVFSMSDSYDISSQWGTYADSNKGFCIEYDFSKITDEVILKNLRKVNYTDNREALSYKDLFLDSFLDTNPKEKMVSIIEKQLLTKDISW